MKQTVKKLLFMLGIMCLTIFGKETSTTVLADNLDEIENYTIYAEPDWEDGSVYSDAQCVGFSGEDETVH